MKCKYYWCKDECDQKYENAEIECHSGTPYCGVFDFEKFWKENLSDNCKDNNHTAISCRNINCEIEWMIQFWKEADFDMSFESNSIIEVCEKALKYKEENEKKN
jgi:hypothetical protein